MNDNDFKKLKNAYFEEEQKREKIQKLERKIESAKTQIKIIKKTKLDYNYILKEEGFYGSMILASEITKDEVILFLNYLVKRYEKELAELNLGSDSALNEYETKN